MATTAQREALLGVPCPWCGAGVRVECGVPTKDGHRLRITTLDGGCHDARWRAAFGIPARVLSASVEERTPALAGADERPW